jgi:dTDP-glucose 4,6-dehydratase
VDIEKEPNYTFIKEILLTPFIDALFAEHQFDGVLHLAAESHVIVPLPILYHL